MSSLMNKIKNILDSAGVKYELIQLPEDIAMDIDVHMKFHGKNLSQAMPNMVFKTERGLIVAQRRGDTEIDSKKLKKLIGVQRLSLARKEGLEDLGLKPGIVPPVGFDVTFYIDRKVFENDEIYTGSGDISFALKINPKDLTRLNKAIVGDFTYNKEEMGKKRVLSGIRATGRLHLGNYLGAVKGMLELQSSSDYETFYTVVDLHTITTPYDPKTLPENVRNIIIDYLAAGLDPEKSTIFVQSHVPEHLELAYFFSTVVTVGKMQDLPTFKEKVRQYPHHVTMALLSYPVLMAADILVYKAGLVPVGIDQEPHLEVAREIARRMNQDFGTDFPEPQRFKTEGEYVPSLTGEGKMSKSVEGSYINLDDNLETIKAKLAKVPTDSGGGRLKDYQKEPLTPEKIKRYEKDHTTEQLGVATLMTFVELFQGQEKREQYEKQYVTSGIRYQQLKEELAEAIFRELEPMQKERVELEKDASKVDQIIADGASRARSVAKQTLLEVKKAMGLI